MAPTSLIKAEDSVLTVDTEKHHRMSLYHIACGRPKVDTVEKSTTGG
jgi:hypothetical protein